MRLDPRSLALPVLLLAAIAGAALAGAQLSVDQARALFEQLGCTSCHTKGGVASSWEEILRGISDWARRYPSLDEAVRSEVEYFGGKRFNSFDELMEFMGRNVGASAADVEKLKEFFTGYFEAARSGTGAQAGAPTATAAPAQEATPASPAGHAPYLVFGAAAAIVAAFVAAALLLRRR